ncbi:MAG TPA: UDP-N-acetylmuramate--L-alanine ligase [Chitinophagaceae bacterium]|nr:UDP-N-acetylmuramate--L-alanine ligase [Chitinophagaceae bacterium]
MNLENLHSVYFIGIGGIGMSALARFFNERKVNVSGYDKTPTPLTDLLIKEGIKIHFEENIDLINKEVDLVVYTPAIPATHIELIWYQQSQIEVVKRSDVLQSISHYMQAICVAGTHGKTTISTLISHILRHTNYGCNAFLGGISSNYGVNYWQSENKCAVIEADEYDRSFLKLQPSIAVVTAMDADHLDIYGTVEEMERCYLQFITQIKDTLVYKHGLKHSNQFQAPNKVSYSLQNDASTYYASNIKMSNGSYSFTFNKEGHELGDIVLHIGGMHNIENTIAALAVCNLLNLDIEKVKLAVEAFKGVKRRFEYIIKNDHIVYIDDYAHHPEELKMLISSAKTLFKGRKVSVVFQPHLFTRTRDFVDGFAESLDLADEVILLDIYPARELPIEGVTSEIILNKMSLNNKHILSKESTLKWVEASRLEILITAGAGDIDNLIEPIKNILSNK